MMYCRLWCTQYTQRGDKRRRQKRRRRRKQLTHDEAYVVNISCAREEFLSGDGCRLAHVAIMLAIDSYSRVVKTNSTAVSAAASILAHPKVNDTVF